MAGGAEAERDHQTDGEAPGLQREVDQPSTRPMEKNDGSDGSELKSSSLNQGGILRALEVVERDSMAIAESFSSLFASLRLALSEVTSSSVDHMRCFGDASGRVQESALDAATKGNRYINSCLRLAEPCSPKFWRDFRFLKLFGEVTNGSWN